MPRTLIKTAVTKSLKRRELQLKALANARRLQILDWLRVPREHFPEQADGDLVTDGVCGVFIAQKLGVSQPTAHQHLKIMVDAGFLAPKRIKQWTFYKRNETALAEIRTATAAL